MTPMRILSFVVLGLALLPDAALSATAPPGRLYWVSMRGITEDAQASYVSASYTEGGVYTSAFLACGHTYYLTMADAATVQASRTAGDTVQVHSGEPNTTFAAAGIVCLVQVDQ